MMGYMKTTVFRPLAPSERKEIADRLEAGIMRSDCNWKPRYVARIEGKREGKYAYGYGPLDSRVKVYEEIEINEWNGVELPPSILKNNP